MSVTTVGAVLSTSMSNRVEKEGIITRITSIINKDEEGKKAKADKLSLTILFIDPYQIGEEREISNVLIVMTTFRMVYANNTCLYYSKQLLILTPQLEVVFIVVYNYIFGCSV